MLTREIAITQATEFINICISNGLEIDKAILFGSSIKNQLREHSDIDLALVSPLFSKNFIQNSKLTSRINVLFPLIEIHHFNKDYYEKGDPFIEEINTTGLILNI